MPVFTNFSIVRYEDGVLTVQLVNPAAVGGWDIRADFSRRLGGTPFVSKYSYSGSANGVSGITITNSGQGVFQVKIDSPDTSGFYSQNVAYDINRTNSGHVTCISQGYVSVFPG